MSAPTDPKAATAGTPGGVNLVGYMRAESGVGEIGRLLSQTLEAARIPYRVISFDETRSRQEHDFAAGDSDATVYDVNIVCINADQVPVFAERHGAEFLRDRYSVGVWAWEVEDFPQWMAASALLLDEVWGISTHTAEVLAHQVTCPVHAFPLPVSPPPATPVQRADLGLPDEPFFLFCFDFDSVVERKNPLGVIEAFERAFGDRPAGSGTPHLVLKSINGDYHPERVEALRRATRHPRIHFFDRYLTRGEHLGLVEQCYAYVSLHRAEGFGLTMAEAMLAGKPVIATAYSANLDFMNDRNSLLVPFEWAEVPPGSGPYIAGGRWADPDVGAAAGHMRELIAHPARAAALGQQARRDLQERHSPKARVPLLRERLREIAIQRPASPEEKRLELLLDAGGPGLRSGRRWLALRWLHGLRQRVLRSMIRYQEQIHHSLLQVIRERDAASRREMMDRIHLQELQIERLECELRLLRSHASFPGPSPLPDDRELHPPEAARQR
jgi:glycosyltransferase involved in cell wall biosynthesis